jgi:neutral trehalase
MIGFQGCGIAVENYSVLDDGSPNKPWNIESREWKALAYCSDGGYSTDPFSGKNDDSRISNAIEAMWEQFYEDDAGGALLLFDTDVRWVSGPTGSFSSISSSSISSSSLSSSSFSSESESISSESIGSASSESSESIP